MQLQLFYKKGSSGDPNLLWVRHKGKVQVKIPRRYKYKFDLKSKISITDKYMGVVRTYGHKIGENKMTQGECTEMNSQEDQRCRPEKPYH